MKELDHINAYVVLFATGKRTHQHQPSVDEQTATTKSVQDAAIKDACITHMISGRTWRRWNTDFLSAGGRFIILQSRRVLSFLDVYPEFATAYRKFMETEQTRRLKCETMAGFCTEWLTQHFNVDQHGWLLDQKEMEDGEEEEEAAAAEEEQVQVQELVGGEGGAAVDAGGRDAAPLKRARASSPEASDKDSMHRAHAMRTTTHRTVLSNVRAIRGPPLPARKIRLYPRPVKMSPLHLYGTANKIVNSSHQHI